MRRLFHFMILKIDYWILRDRFMGEALNHIAIIMDGNGRWAKEKGLDRKDGHLKGSGVIEEVSKWCTDNHVSYLTLFAFSTENWKRPKSEIAFLMKLLERYLKEKEPIYMEKNIRFLCIGNLDVFSKALQKSIKSLQKKTEKNGAQTIMSRI